MQIERRVKTLGRARLLAESVSRVVAAAIGAALSFGGWMILFAGAWRIGLWIIILSGSIIALVLWNGGPERR